MSLDVSLFYNVEDDNHYEVYTRNITHNLGSMASKAGIYRAMWRPEEIGAVKAKDIIKLLEDGYKWLRHNRKLAEELNPENGWGDYTGLLDFVNEYVQACIDNPNALIEISR